MSKHTPGPWEWSNSSYYGFTSLWNSQTRQEVLVPGGRNDGDDPIVWMGEEMSEADKALIVAAPDLLEALKGYMHAMEGFAEAVRAVTGTAYPWEAQDIERAKALAAIAKAEGPADDGKAPAPEASAKRDSA